MAQFKIKLDPSLDAMFEHALAYSVNEMKFYGRVQPCFFGRLSNGRIMMIGCTDEMMASIATKMQFAFTARKVFRDKGVTHYSYISEIWIAAVTSPEDHLRKYDPRQQDGRFEGLMLIAGDATQTLGRHFFTVRNGETFDTFKLKTNFPGGGEEWFYNLLQDQPHPLIAEWVRAAAAEKQ